MKINLTNILLLALVAGVWFGNIGGCKKQGSIKPELQLLDSIRKMNREHTDYVIEQVQSELRQWKVEDSIRALNVQQVKKRINEIPDRINTLSDDDLWRAISKAYPAN